VAAWRLAAEIRSMCSSLQRDIPADAMVAATADWIAWALEQENHIDPMTRPLTVPQIPEPTPACLERLEEPDPLSMLED